MQGGSGKKRGREDRVAGYIGMPLKFKPHSGLQKVRRKALGKSTGGLAQKLCRGGREKQKRYIIFALLVL